MAVGDLTSTTTAGTTIAGVDISSYFITTGANGTLFYLTIITRAAA